MIVYSWNRRFAACMHACIYTHGVFFELEIRGSHQRTPQGHAIPPAAGTSTSTGAGAGTGSSSGSGTAQTCVAGAVALGLPKCMRCAIAAVVTVNAVPFQLPRLRLSSSRLTSHLRLISFLALSPRTSITRTDAAFYVSTRCARPMGYFWWLATARSPAILFVGLTPPILV